MPREPSWDSSFNRDDVNVRIPVVLGAEGDPRTVGRKGGAGLNASIGRQPAGRASVRIGYPEITRIGKGDMPPAGRRIAQEARVHGVDSTPAE